MNETQQNEIGEIKNAVKEFAKDNYSSDEIQDLTLTIESVLAVEPNETNNLNIQNPISFEERAEKNKESRALDDFAKSNGSNTHNITADNTFTKKELIKLERARFLK